jgi:hypothetical protein
LQTKAVILSVPDLEVGGRLHAGFIPLLSAQLFGGG